MARRYNEAKNAEIIDKEGKLKNLRYNLLLIRETYHIFHPEDKAMEKFYEALGVSDDIYSRFLLDGQISKASLKSITSVLTDCGVSQKYLSVTRPPKIYTTDKLTKFFEIYANPDSTTNEKTKSYLKIRQTIHEAWWRDVKNVSMLLLGTYGLSAKIKMPDEDNLYRATETLKNFLDYDFSKSTLKSTAFADFITSLAENVNKVEDVFPEFYAVAQQMKEGKTTQSVMNEICKNLDSLNEMEITEEDANSDSCLNMILKLSRVMCKMAKTTPIE